MSVQQINPSPCLKRLSEDGYHVVLQHGAVQVRSIPYLKSDGTTAYGTLHAPLHIVGGNQAGLPQIHTVAFIGEYPCGHDGRPTSSLIIGQVTAVIDGVNVQGHQMSQKPQATGKYKDWYDQLSTYAKLISGPAIKQDPSLSSKPGNIPLTNPAEDVFCYPNNATTRNGTAHLETKLAGLTIGIIGLGGTGSHVLDKVSKTRLSGIHIFDDDILETHNAFRGPGVVPVEILKTSPHKVEHYADVYGKLRRDINAYPIRVSADNLNILDNLDFVFLCVDVSPAKAEIVKGLLDRRIPFVDTGIGAELNELEITGIIRSTLVTPEDPESALKSVIVESSDNNLYATNIQVAELNAMNACLAVMQFKTYFGFYKSRPGSKPNWIMPIGKDRPINMGEPTSNNGVPSLSNNKEGQFKPSGDTDVEAA